jgi:hypothetical protein
MRHTISNAYLTAYWSFALPPPNSGVTSDLTWLAAQLEPFAVKPGGTGHWILFWISVAFGLGWLIRTRPALGISLGLLPVSACVLAVLRIVPLFERLSLWILPALYAGVGGLADFAGCHLRRRAADVVKERAASPLKRGAAVAATVAVLVIAFDAGRRIPGQIAHPQAGNHGLNDRAAVQWLVAQRQPGDDVMSSGHGLAAIWWYGGIPIPTPKDAGRLADGGIMFEVSRDESRRCASESLRDALKGHRRLLLYLGWPADEDREAFDEWVVDTLGEIGSIDAIRRFETGRALVMELGRPMPHAGILRASQFGKKPSEAPPPRRLRGCLLARPAARW